MSNKKVKVNWDKVWVHGGHPDAKYIRWKDNSHVLPLLAPDLTKAYTERDKMNKQKKLIGLLQKVVVAYRALLNQKQK
jgi:hypothetical protein